MIVDSVRDGAPKPELEKCDYVSEGDDECSPHGWALANLARDLLCNRDGTSCQAEIRTRRVLRWTYRIKSRGRPRDRALEPALPISVAAIPGYGQAASAFVTPAIGMATRKC